MIEFLLVILAILGVSILGFMFHKEGGNEWLKQLAWIGWMASILFLILYAFLKFTPLF